MTLYTFRKLAFLALSAVFFSQPLVAHAQDSGPYNSSEASAPTMVSAAAGLPNLQANDLNGFLNHFCVNFNFPALGNILNSINNILSNAQYFLNSLQNLMNANVNVNVGNPLNCIPNLNVGIGISGLNPNAMLACFNQFPNFQQIMAQIGQCLANQLPNVNVNLPSFDPNAIQQCLQNQMPNVNVGITNPLQALGGLIGAINDLLYAINNLKAALSDLQLNLDFLKNYCQFFNAGATTSVALNQVGQVPTIPQVRFTGKASNMKLYFGSSNIQVGQLKCTYSKKTKKVTCKK